MAAPLFRPDELDRLRAAFLRLIPRSDAFSESLYAHLFALAPGARPLFPDSMDEQRDKIVRMFALMIDALDDPGGFDELCRASGERHVRYGARREHYDVLERALVAALGDVADSASTAAESALWVRLYRAAAERMLASSAL